MINFYYLINYLECGHFCINYVLKKDKIKPKVSYSKDMMNLRLLKDILSEYYQCVKCYMVEGIIQDFIGYKPFITLIKRGKGMNHYVVIESVDDNFVYYYDPLFLFVKKMNVDKFNQKWSKYCCFYFKKSNC